MAAFEFSSIRLENIPSYVTTATFLGVPLTLTFTWNTRMGGRSLTVVNAKTNVCYLQNTMIRPDEIYDFNFNAIDDDYNVHLRVHKIDSSKKSADILNWADDYILTIYHMEDEE